MKLDNLRAQVELHIHVGMSNLLQRYFSIHVMLFACWLAGFRSEVVVLWLFITGIELLSYLVVKAAARTVDLKPVTIFGLIAASFLASAGYYAPVALLADQSDIAFFIAAIVWIMATMATASSMYNVVPVFYWTVGVPGFLVGFYLLVAGMNQTFVASSFQHWLFPIGILCLHVINSVLLRWTSLDADREMNRIRVESLNHLRNLEYVSKHDGLTKLINRSEFDALVAQTLKRQKRGDNVFIIMIDLNGFKPINDTYGHQAGDAVLVVVAERLRTFTAPGITPARFGGDEFAILVQTREDADVALLLAKRLTSAIGHPIHYEGLKLTVTPSVGIAHAGRTGVSVSEICSAADQAMYYAKAHGLGYPVVYDAAALGPRHDLVRRSRLKQAIEDGEIGPFYQPKVRVSDGAHAGFEALARWCHPDQGILMPGTFLPEIKTFGLLAELTHAILRQCLNDMVHWRNLGIDFGKVAINIPEITLATKDGLDDILQILSAFPDYHEHITFEITEDVFIARHGGLIQQSIKDLSAFGIAISLDDFGTGYASFQHLRQLTFDEMKIDTSFVAGLGSDPVADVLVGGFLSIAKGLGVEVVAEGVETEAQFAHLKRLGCQYAQGFLFGRAVPAQDALSYMKHKALPQTAAAISKPVV